MCVNVQDVYYIVYDFAEYGTKLFCLLLVADVFGVGGQTLIFLANRAIDNLSLVSLLGIAVHVLLLVYRCYQRYRGHRDRVTGVSTTLESSVNNKQYEF